MPNIENCVAMSGHSEELPACQMHEYKKGHPKAALFLTLAAQEDTNAGVIPQQPRPLRF
jgi:predicted component of type VI protein secretion system